MEEHRRQKKWIFTVLCVIFIIIVFLGFCISLVIHYDPELLIFNQDSEKLIAAIEKNDVDELRRLLEEGCDPNQTTLPPGKLWSLWEMTAKRPISVACLTGSYELVDLLITYGATAEHIEYTDWSPLQIALDYYEESDFELIKLLLANGANPQIIENGDIPLFVAACISPNKIYSEFEVSNSRRQSEGFKGFVDGLLKALALPLRGGPVASVTETDEYDLVAAMGITRIVDLFLDQESIDSVNNFGESLLICAVRAKNYYLAEFLLSKGCDPSIKDNSGKTAYDYAVEAQDETLISLLSD